MTHPSGEMFSVLQLSYPSEQPDGAEVHVLGHVGTRHVLQQRHHCRVVRVLQGKGTQGRRGQAEEGLVERSGREGPGDRGQTATSCVDVMS
jgi:hypothetical protein